MKIKGIAHNHHPWLKSIEWLGLIVIFSALFISLWAVVWGDNSTSSLKWLQLLQSLGLFLAPAVAVAYLWDNHPMSFLHYDKIPDATSALFAVGIIIIGLPAINLLAYLNEQIVLPDFLHDLEQWMKDSEDSAATLTERFLQTDTIGGLLINLGLMALIPAICEESCFRGILLQLFCTDEPMERTITRRQHLAIWASAIIFSFIHFQFYGFIPRMLLGALLGYLLVWTGSLWTPILAHFTNNACSVIVYFIAYKNGMDIDQTEAFGTGDTLWLGITSCVLVIIGIITFATWQHKKTTI